MTAPEAIRPGVSHATVDADGRLLTAEPAIEALNGRAGGTVGCPLATPQLATIARLARRLGIVVARRVVVADEDTDVELWVRAQLDGEGVRLAVSGWQDLAAALPLVGRDDTAVIDGGGGWRWESDAALRLTRVSPDAARTQGVDAAGLLGQPIGALFTQVGDDAAKPADTFARRERFADLPARLCGSGGELLLSADTVRDATGRFGGFAGSARPAEAASGVVDVQPALTENFTAGLDRALRKPLAQIIANADSITAAGDGPIGGDYADYAADIAHAGRHLLALVDDLVDLEAVERPDFAPANDAIDLVDVARRAAGLLAVRAEQAGVVIERPPASAALPARGDFRRALQILVNLIGNAVRYAPRGSIVLVSRQAAAGHASVTIGDEGKGIAAVDQARIFDKFQRVDPSEPGGNGLGLYIARRLARAMGGDLTLASAPGEGARFTLTLPAEAPGDEDQH